MPMIVQILFVSPFLALSGILIVEQNKLDTERWKECILPATGFLLQTLIALHHRSEAMQLLVFFPSQPILYCKLESIAVSA